MTSGLKLQIVVFLFACAHMGHIFVPCFGVEVQKYPPKILMLLDA